VAAVVVVIVVVVSSPAVVVVAASTQTCHKLASPFISERNQNQRKSKQANGSEILHK
jgi:hypothetical protein